MIGGIFVFLLITNSEVGWLGIKAEMVRKPYRIALGIDHGVIVTDIIGDSPADMGGLKIGDIITRVGDREIYELSDLRPLVRRNPDEVLRFEVLREGEKMAFQIKIGSREEVSDRIREEIKKFIRQLKEEIEKLRDGRV
ncbi:hypothetical protein DRP53_09570 [candidate division WOR-3 bacterium]|uniref:PDZ domain-containing protein n=1 Tax=candidate division WOR-3 bacterium TaxID=2052148 RepID=A0A660SG34_UNCW3|nr:MAG: hypothetical protein DRP53_09570 [candidate division WOR-3 bacterium]